VATIALIATQAVGTFTLRPYVFCFLALFLIGAVRDLGPKRALLFLLWGGSVALVAELSSTNVGIPFGLYHYTRETQGAELFLSNVPLFSPLSFPFLAYAAFCLARMGLGSDSISSRRGRTSLVLVSGVLMMLLDVVIDPVAVRGNRWFLGHIFFYPDGGVYFGVPLSNFLGWLLVGWAAVGGFIAGGRSGGGSPVLGVLLYYSVLVVNLAITVWIGEWAIAAVGILFHIAAFLLLYGVNRAVAGRWSPRLLSVSAASSGARAP